MYHFKRLIYRSFSYLVLLIYDVMLSDLYSAATHFEGVTDWYQSQGYRELDMSSASSAVAYTSVYTDSELGRVFWGYDEEPSDGGPP
ncbi:hypothetical protein Tco_0701705 [Tanacetum coccineum]